MLIRFLFVLSFSFSVLADLSTLESLTSEWVALRAERSREAESWADEKSRVRLELSLLEEAESRLREELEILRERGDEEEAAQADLLAELSERRVTEETLRPVLVQAQTALRDWLAGLAPSMRRLLDEDVHALDAAGEDLVQRSRAILALQNQALELQTSLRVAPHMVEMDGARREMDVLWIGTTRAFAVSADDRLAARGRFHNGLWRWETVAGMGPTFRRAVQIAAGEAAPTLISLPMEGGQ